MSKSAQVDVEATNSPLNESMESSSSRSSNKLLYVICFIANMLVNFDHGIVPAASKEIKVDLSIADFQLGILGSLVYAGLLVGSLAASWAFVRFNTRILVFLIIVAYMGSLMLFLATDAFIVLGLSRALVGFFQVFLVVFFPVWVDLHGGSRATLQLTFLQLGVPLGVFLGYIVTSLYVKYLGNWQLSFLTQVVLLAPCGLALFCFDSSDIDVQMQEESNLEVEEKQQLSSSQDKIKLVRQESNLSSNAINARMSAAAMRMSIEPTLKRIQQSNTYIETLRRLLSNRLYMYTMLTLAALYFVVTGIQFWVSDYMRSVLLVDQKTVFTSFAFISITAPTLGVVLGGIAVDKAGGYANPKALNICMASGVLASVCGLPIPMLNDFRGVIVLLWFLLFFGGSLMPPVTGLMLKSVPKNMSAFAYSTASLFHNLLGYLPAPFVYGFVNERHNHDHIPPHDPPQQPSPSRAGMILLMSWSVWGIIGLFFARREKLRLLALHPETQGQISSSMKHQNETKAAAGTGDKGEDCASDKLLSKITEKESESSQQNMSKDNIMNKFNDDFLDDNDKGDSEDDHHAHLNVKQQQQQPLILDGFGAGLPEAKITARPYAYAAVANGKNGQKGVYEPLLLSKTSLTKSGSMDNMHNRLAGKNFQFGGSLTRKVDVQSNSKSKMRLDFSKIQPKYYKFNQTPKSSITMSRSSSTAFLTIGNIFGKSNSILFIDDEDDDYNNNNINNDNGEGYEEDQHDTIAQQLKDIQAQYKRDVEMHEIQKK